MLLLLPLNPTFREPIIHKQASKPGHFYKVYVLEIKASRTLSYATGSKTSSWTIGGASVKRSAYLVSVWLSRS